jgi:CheY-like chemotaxis protein
MPLRILIADDSATNRLLFKTTVTRMGHHADVVATGREAIDLFAQN